MSQNKSGLSYSKILNISFIFVLIVMIGLFYFFPRRGADKQAISGISSIKIVLAELPPTIKNLKKNGPQPFIPKIVVPTEQPDILDSVALSKSTVPTEQAAPFNDYPLSFPRSKLLPGPELNDFNPDSVLKKPGPLYSYRNYLKRKLITAEPSANPESPLADEIWDKKTGNDRSRITVQIPIGQMIQAAKNGVFNDRKKGDLKLDDLLFVAREFYVMEWLYNDKPKSLPELYSIDSLQNRHTYTTLQSTLKQLSKHGLVIQAPLGGEIYYAPMYSVDEMIGWINRFLVDPAAEKKDCRNQLLDMLHRLVLWG
jgi:predicted transcriptional regulator